MQDYYNYILATHIVFVVAWFAALFYIVRLYIYHTEALQKPEPDKHILAGQFSIMEKRLMQIIGTPAMIITITTGIWLLSMQTLFLEQGWLHFKITFVLLIICYHFYCLRIQKKLAKGIHLFSTTQLRLFNELATIFLVAIVFLVKLKNSIGLLYGVAGILTLGVLLLFGVFIYKRFRKS